MAEAAAGAGGRVSGESDGGAAGRESAPIRGGGSDRRSGEQQRPAGSSMDAQIAELRRQRERLGGERKQVRKELKNAMKKRSRLKKKASRLSNNDLFDLIQLRELNAQARNGTPERSAAAASGVDEAAHPGTGREEGEGGCPFHYRLSLWG